MTSIPPLVPTPTLALSETTALQARIGALEARIQALEAIISQNADGVTINSRGNLTLKSAKDCTIRSERDVSLDVRGSAAVAVGRELVVDVTDHYRVSCGSAFFDMRRSGEIEMSGSRVSVKGSSEVAIKGSKISQN